MVISGPEPYPTSNFSRPAAIVTPPVRTDTLGDAASDSRFLMQTADTPVVTSYSGALLLGYLNREAIIVEVTESGQLFQVKAASKSDRLVRTPVKVVG